MSFLEVLAASPGLFVSFTFVIGLIVGSFLNVVIHRVPKMMEAAFRHECALLDLPEDAEPATPPKYNLVIPRSACPSCSAPIAAYDNVPVLSWILLRGKCRHCLAPISIRYPSVELLTGLTSAGMAIHFGYGLAAAGAIVFCWMLIALFFIDADTGFLPDDLTLPLLWAGLLINTHSTYTSLPSAVVGAAAGYLILWSVYQVHHQLTGREGMGYGDFKLLAAIGAWLGWMVLPLVILMSSVVALIIAVPLLIMKKRGWSKSLPYGPYLAAAGVIMMVWGPDIQRALFGAMAG